MKDMYNARKYILKFCFYLSSNISNYCRINLLFWYK